MDFSTLKPWQEVSETGVIYEWGSIYARILKLTDLRKARGKQYSLEALLMIVLLAKLSGQDRPVEIADWAKNNQKRLIELLHFLKGKGAPSQYVPAHLSVQSVSGRDRTIGASASCAGRTRSSLRG